MYSEAKKQVPVPEYERDYTTQGTHVATTTIPYYNVTLSSISTAHVGPAPLYASGDNPDECTHWPNDPGNTLPPCLSPLVIDMDGDGLRLTTAANGVDFDIDGDGDLDRIGWTAEGSDDAWLTMDRNGNGKIDSGKELFGNFTPATTGSEVTCPNGFEALKFVEDPSYGVSVRNEVIDGQDTAYAGLLLWRDRNHNGISEPSELRPITKSVVTSLQTDYREVSRVRRGNTIKQRGTVTLKDGSRRPMLDVWLDSIS